MRSAMATSRSGPKPISLFLEWLVSQTLSGYLQGQVRKLQGRLAGRAFRRRLDVYVRNRNPHLHTQFSEVYYPRRAVEGLLSTPYEIRCCENIGLVAVPITSWGQKIPAVLLLSVLLA